VKMVKIKPTQDFRLYCPPHCDLFLKDGEEIEVPEFLIDNLITENIIDNIPEKKEKSKKKRGK